MICGAIDLGGTKIEARLFDASLETVETHRIPTPVDDFETFMDGLAAQVGWLLQRSHNAALPVGICIPGVMNPDTGICFASNVPISGRNVRDTLRDRFGRSFVFGNDCMAFAYSEAHGGAGEGFESVVGLILGTGMAAGLCVGGRLPRHRNGMAVEIGHAGMPSRALRPFDLPDWPCGCGKTGCTERYIAGVGMAALTRHFIGEAVPAHEIAARAGNGDEQAEHVLSVWAELAAESLLTLQLMFDPDCIVIGGGLSKMDGILQRLEPALERRLLGHTSPPELRTARHGDSSGARGMALLALHEANEMGSPAS